jgi:CRISPR-associated protein Cas1
MVLDGGRLSILRPGAYVTVRGDEIVLLHRRKEVGRCSVASVECLLLQAFGISLGAEVPLRLSESGAIVVVASPSGTRIAVLGPAGEGNGRLRVQQAVQAEGPAMVSAGLAMLRAKVANQASVLRYFARYRKRSAAPLYDELLKCATAIRAASSAINGLDESKLDLARLRNAAMGHEGRAAALYWRGVASLVGGEAQFPGRRTRGAEDAVNQALNYAYGILYGEVWRAIAAGGLDPSIGILHGSEQGAPNLVLDLIEELRAPFADRVVLSLIGRGFRPEIGSESRLRSRTRRVLALAFGRLARKPIRWRSRSTNLRQILESQVRQIVKILRGEANTYLAFHLRW